MIEPFIDYQPGLAATRVIWGGGATVSWVLRQTPVGLLIKDQRPPAQVSRKFFQKPCGCRITNLLEGWISTADGRLVDRYGWGEDSKLYQALSFLDIPAQGYPPLRTARRVWQNGIEGVVFEQIAGARTLSPAVIGGVVGTLAGGRVRRWLGSLAGLGCGVFTANRLMNFPPIWTRLQLTLWADGRQEVRMAGHSRFPCHILYQTTTTNEENRPYRRVAHYVAHRPEQNAWSRQDWHNPWQIQRPKVRILDFGF